MGETKDKKRKSQKYQKQSEKHGVSHEEGKRAEDIILGA